MQFMRQETYSATGLEAQYWRGFPKSQARPHREIHGKALSISVAYMRILVVDHPGKLFSTNRRANIARQATIAAASASKCSVVEVAAKKCFRR